MSGLSITLYAFEAIAGISALGILFVRNVFHAALLLIVCLLSLAGVFVLYHAEFIAVTQILVYAGGILVLIIFGVMLTSRIAGKGELVVKNQYVFSAGFLAVLIAVILIKLFSEQHFSQQKISAELSSHNSIQQTGILLMSDYVLPFEVAGVLLLVALLGAAVTASSFNAKKE